MADRLSAGRHVIETHGSKGTTINVKADHFQVAFEKVKPSVSGKVYIYHLFFTRNRRIAVILARLSVDNVSQNSFIRFFVVKL